MASPLQAIMAMLQGQRPQVTQVRPDFGLTGAQISPQRSPYERTMAPGEKRSAGDLQDMLGEVILAAGSMAVPGIGPKLNTPISAGSRRPMAKPQAPNLESPEFKSWFGDWKTQPQEASKVVSPTGEPLVVYHQTNRNFSKFDSKKATMGGIHWFTSDRGSIDRGETGAQGSGRVMELFAKIKNPASWEQYEKFGLGELKSRGYDGAILKNPDGTFDGFVFDGAQLKSATRNRGTFDPNNPRIDE